MKKRERLERKKERAREKKEEGAEESERKHSRSAQSSSSEFLLQASGLNSGMTCSSYWPGSQFLLPSTLFSRCFPLLSLRPSLSSPNMNSNKSPLFDAVNFSRLVYLACPTSLLPQGFSSHFFFYISPTMALSPPFLSPGALLHADSFLASSFTEILRCPVHV